MHSISFFKAGAEIILHLDIKTNFVITNSRKEKIKKNKVIVVL